MGNGEWRVFQNEMNWIKRKRINKLKKILMTIEIIRKSNGNHNVSLTLNNLIEFEVLKLSMMAIITEIEKTHPKWKCALVSNWSMTVIVIVSTIVSIHSQIVTLSQKKFNTKSKCCGHVVASELLSKLSFFYNVEFCRDRYLRESFIRSFLSVWLISKSKVFCHFP